MVIQWENRPDTTFFAYDFSKSGNSILQLVKMIYAAMWELCILS